MQKTSLFKIAKLFLVLIGLSLITASRKGRKEISRIKERLPKWYCWLYIYLFVEVVFVYVLKSNSLRSWTLFLFGNKYNFATFDYYTGRLYGLFSEPSTVAFTLFIDSLVVIAKEKQRFKWKETTFHALCIMFFFALSLSFSALLYLSILYVLLIIVILRQRSLPFAKVLIVMAPFLALIFLQTSNGQYFLSRFSSTIEVINNLSEPDLLSKTSEASRLYSIYYLFNMFLRHPLFGVGFDVTYSYSALVTSLATIGIFGTTAAISLFISFYRPFKQKITFLGCFFFLLCFVFAGQIGSFLLYYPSTCIIFYAVQSICQKKRALPKLKVDLINIMPLFVSSK